METLILKLTKFMMVSIFVLAIISFGAVSAASDTTADDAVGVTDDVEIASPDVGEINTDGDDVAIGDVNDDSKLGASDDEKLSAGTVTPKYTIDVTPNVMSGSTYVAQYGQVITVNGTFENATGNVTIKFGYSGNFQTFEKTLVDGKFSQDITNYTVRNNYQISVNYKGDDYYKTASWSKNIHVKLDDVVAGNADYGQMAYIIANLYNATGNVNFTLNSKTYSGKLENGTFTQEFKNYTLGKNSVTFYYEGDDKFNPLEKTISFTVKANIDEPTIYNYQPAIINAYLGEATGKVNFTYNGEVYQADIKNGVATQEILNYEIGENTVEVTYLGDADFNPFTKEITFTVLDKQNPEIYSAVYQNNGVNVISVYIPYSNGTVNVTVNGKRMVLDLVDGQALYPITAEDDIKNIKVTYDGNVRLNPGKSSYFLKLDNVVNEENWRYYFNQEDNGNLFNFIPAGITLDFQGSIINYNQEEPKCIAISKPVNVISSTKDAYINLNTVAGSLLGEYQGSSFVVNYGGSGSNITGLSFYNTQLWITNTSNVVFDNISVVVEDQRVGSGVGVTSVRDNSSYVTIKNSYFYTENNGGSTTFTFSWASHCIFDNNIVKVEGNVGNLVYLNTYNIYTNPPTGVPLNTYNKVTNNVIYGKSGSSISVGIVVEGAYNIIENNTLYKAGISTIWGSSFSANTSYIGNILLEGGNLAAYPNSLVYNNVIAGGTLSTGDNSVAYNNTVAKAMTVGKESEAYDNNVGGLTLSGADAYVHDNVVNGATTISQANIIVSNNNFTGDNTIKFSSANAKNVTFANNDVNGNIEFTAKAINSHIVGNMIATSKSYAIDLKTNTGINATIENNILSSADNFGNGAVNHAEDETLVLDNYQNATASITVAAENDNIKVGQTAVLNVVTNETSISSVEITVGTRTFTLDLSNGKGTLEVKDLLAGNYDVAVVSLDKKFAAKNTTKLNVTKNVAPKITVEVPEVTQGIDSNIVITIENATGSVTLTFDSMEEVTANLVNGVATLKVPVLSSGKHNFTVAYSGDNKYFANETNSSLTVNKNKSVKISFGNLIFDGRADELIISFKDWEGYEIYGADVTVKVGNDLYELITDYGGEVIIDLNLTAGKYPVSVVFDAVADQYDKTTAEANIIVYQKTIITIDSISSNAVSGVLKDADGKAIANAIISYSIAGDSKKTVTTGNDGSFSIKPTKNGLITFNYAGSEIYNASSGEVTLTNVVPPAPVVKKATKIKAANKKFKAKAKKKIVSVTLLSGKTKVKSKVITIKIKGKTFKAKTNSKGIAKIKVKLSKKGKYTATVKFAGDNNYKESSKKIKITIK